MSHGGFSRGGMARAASLVAEWARAARVGAALILIVPAILVVPEIGTVPVTGMVTIMVAKIGMATTGMVTIGTATTGIMGIIITAMM